MAASCWISLKWVNSYKQTYCQILVIIDLIEVEMSTRNLCYINIFKKRLQNHKYYYPVIWKKKKSKQKNNNEYSYQSRRQKFSSTHLNSFMTKDLII